MQEGERQILVLQVQGIICVNDLPPVKTNQQVIRPICKKNIPCLLIGCRFATAESRLDIQQVRLTGLGIEEFKDAITAITKVWQFLSHRIGQISINQTSTFFENSPAITISNRYLTPIHHRLDTKSFLSHQKLILMEFLKRRQVSDMHILRIMWLHIFRESVLNLGTGKFV